MQMHERQHGITHHQEQQQQNVTVPAGMLTMTWLVPEQSLVNTAVILPVLTPACHHIVILLLMLKLLNVNLKLNFLDESSTTDNERFISAPGQLHRVALYKFRLYCIVLILVMEYG